MEQTQQQNKEGRDALIAWQKDCQKNVYAIDQDYQHTVSLYLKDKMVKDELFEFGELVPTLLDKAVAENNCRENLPRFEPYSGLGERIDEVVHHPSYVQAGDWIYGTQMLKRLSKPGGLLESLSFFFLSGEVGEGGHNCPFACSAGIVRVLQKADNVPHAEDYVQKITEPSFSNGFTGAQFLTEVQGGSDVGKNATRAYQDEEGRWRIQGEKWFCSNANADLILMTARYDEAIDGTRGLGLFLVPTRLENGKHNHFRIRRLKEKIGTRSMASGEIDFNGAYAFVVGKPEEGFKLVMENVLHLSRLCNTACILGMARRALFIASYYAKHRIAFGQPILNYPLVQENLAQIRVENTAMISGLFATLKLQDEADLGKADDKTILLLRLLANLNKYLSAKWSVEHIHHTLDVLAGNGAIETFSSIPRLFRDSIVCENWEGTHNTLRMQTLRDVLKYQVDEILIEYIIEKLKVIEDNRKEALHAQLGKLKTLCKALRSSELAAQSLLIRDVVDEMAVLFMSLHLLLEGLKECKNKLLAFDYFSRLHFSDSSKGYDKTYLSMIAKLAIGLLQQ